MGYRGDDLDLRTPEGAPEQDAPGEFSPFQASDPLFVTSRQRAARDNGRLHAPIWVDDTALDCCNHAFDVAQAHRAGEVRLEHLIYALTRVDEAADALELRGIRVAVLRRDAATAIASEIPAVHGSSKSSPRRADAFEKVLRLAAALAYRRNEPVSVGDLIHVLFDGGIDAPGLERLLGSLARGGYDSFDPEAARERMRLLSAPGAFARPFNADFGSVGTASNHYAQQSRIDTLEQTIRSFMSEMANERKILSGVLQDLQRELMAQRDETTRLGGLPHDKLQSPFGDRLQGLEQAYLAGRGPATADVGVLQDRLALVERALLNEISAVRHAVEALLTRPAMDYGALEQRIGAIEEALASERERAIAGEQKLTQGLAALAAGIERQPGEIAAVVATPLIEHLNGLTVSRDSQHAAVSDSLAEASRRIEALNEAFQTHVERSESATARSAETVDSLRDGVVRLGEAIDEQHARLAETLTQDISDLHDGLSRLDTGQQVLSSSVEQQGNEAVGAFTGLAARIDSLERSAVRPMEMLEDLSATVEKMHKVTVEKYYRRNRFWYWLFGTDDWLAASWPSQSARIADELRALKR